MGFANPSFPPRVSAKPLEVITTLGLTTGLKIVLDAGDSNSYPGTGTKWLDLSGNGYDFDFGAGVAAPTFNGNAGRRSLSEYFSFDGGDVFNYDTTNETWMQNLHKDNATFTIAYWVQFGSLAVQRLSGTDGGTTTGFNTLINASGNAGFQVRNATVTVLSLNNATAVSAAAGWTFWAISLNEATGAGGGLWRTNNVTSTNTSTYVSPAAGNATFTFQIGAGGNSAAPMSNGSRMAEVMIWESVALTATNLLDVYNGTRGRFGV